MKTLDTRAAEILRALLALRTNKIDNSNGAYKPVHIALIGRRGKYNLISITQYGELKGKRMRDPEMQFALDTATQQFIPYYYCNDYIDIETYSAIPTAEGLTHCNEERLADYAHFANRWLRNIAEQQNIPC